MTKNAVYVFTECPFIQNFKLAEQLWDKCGGARYLRPHHAAEFPMRSRYRDRQWFDGYGLCVINLEGVITMAVSGQTIRVVDTVEKVQQFLAELEGGQE